MGWLRVLDIPFDILASLWYRSTRHVLPEGTNMPPRAPQVRKRPKTHATPTRAHTHSTDDGTQGAGPHGPCGQPGSLRAVAGALGSSPITLLEVFGHVTQGRVEEECW